ncbi:MAG: ABC transporter permease [Candidatus Aureabacteria bacterium]|nr:ABC transporter permease [Candidatus Auribacterota bacterium]
MLELTHVSKTYQMGTVSVHALQDVSVKINEGEYVAIIGPSGSGKSTLLHVIGCLDRPDTGSYLMGGREITKLTDDQLAVLRNKMMGFVFQQFHLLPYANALENVELPLVYAGQRHLKERARIRLGEVGLSERSTHRPTEMSGGEQQRVAIARSLVNEPPIILADEPTGNLDSKSEAEVIAILEDLNKKGKTVVIVTHEPEIAKRARRTISMRDGWVISDEKRDSVRGEDKTAGPPGLFESVMAGAHAGVGKAEFGDHIRQALRAICSHKMRSSLSMLGILIGVGAVIAMLALGTGAKESIAQRLASMGSNLLMVRAGSHQLHGVALEAGSVTRFTTQDVDAIAKLPEAKRVSPSVTGRAQVVYGNKNWNTKVEGTGVDYKDLRAANPTLGRFFTAEEIRSRQKVALLGVTVARALFGDANPVGATVKINRINFLVIGLLPEKGATGFQDQDDTIIIPISTAMYRLLGKDYLDSIYVEGVDPEQMSAAEKGVRDLIIKRHRLTKDKEDTFEIRNMAEMQAALQSTTKTMTWLLGSIAAISLLVGGIGIMNIMLVSVTERTREIGLRKAIGARGVDIMIQFLIESAVMTFSGGLAGIALGVGLSALMANLAGWAVRVSLFSIVLAASFSIAVGILFGLWPARSAARLNPIEALRYE